MTTAVIIAMMASVTSLLGVGASVTLHRRNERTAARLIVTEQTQSVLDQQTTAWSGIIARQTEEIAWLSKQLTYERMRKHAHKPPE